MPETAIFAGFCLLDMISTIIFLRSGMAVEGNPVMAPLLHHHGDYIPFVLGKMASFLVPLAGLEIIRPLAPDLIRRCLQIATVGYLFIYFCGMIASMS
jgi:hypothetical protein